MVKHSELKPGMVVVKQHAGGDRLVRIVRLEDDIKNGEPGFDGLLVNGGDPTWGYTGQIRRIVR